MPAAVTSRRPRVAIVHDALVNAGGAERVATFLCEAFPEAPLYTSVYLPDRTYAEFGSRVIHVLPGAAWARTEARAKRMLPLWLLGFRQLDLREYDVVLSSTTFAAKHIRPPRGVRHVSYCYAPFRLLWQPEAYEPSSLPVGAVTRGAIDLARPLLRAWDRAAMDRVSAIATTCRNMARAIAGCYHRQAEVIYAPVRLAEYRLGTDPGDYYLTVSRLVSHKRVDLAVKACRQLRQRLVVVGDGPELANLRALADEHVTFAGLVDKPSLIDLYAGCRALLFCSEEDYGLAPIEAQASGRPVVAYQAGGALETVIEGQSGIFFGEQTTESLMEAILRFERTPFDPDRVRASVARFDVEPFKRDLRDFVWNTTTRAARTIED
jgi:glycosyltransferase involved in cell wall biosynthesis